MKKSCLILLVAAFVFVVMSGFGSAAPCGGVVACSCNDTLSSSRTLNASDNITGCTGSGAGLTINASNVVLDCAAYSINGTLNGTGIMVTGLENITIKNCTIGKFLVGVNFTGVNGSTLSKNIITNNTFGGVLLRGSLNNVISGGEFGWNNQGSGFGLGGVIITSGSNGNNITGGVYMHNNKNSAVEITISSNSTIIDGNNINTKILGKSKKVLLNKKELRLILLDNPMGQNDEMTPFIVIRKV